MSISLDGSMLLNGGLSVMTDSTFVMLVAMAVILKSLAAICCDRVVLKRLRSISPFEMQYLTMTILLMSLVGPDLLP